MLPQMTLRTSVSPSAPRRTTMGLLKSWAMRRVMFMIWFPSYKISLTLHPCPYAHHTLLLLSEAASGESEGAQAHTRMSLPAIILSYRPCLGHFARPHFASVVHLAAAARSP